MEKAEWGECPIPADTVVTRGDSILAGNCPTETARIADIVGSQATAGRIWQYMTTNESASLRFHVIRAMCRALLRTNRTAAHGARREEKGSRKAVRHEVR